MWFYQAIEGREVGVNWSLSEPSTICYTLTPRNRDVGPGRRCSGSAGFAEHHVVPGQGDENRSTP